MGGIGFRVPFWVSILRIPTGSIIVFLGCTLGPSYSGKVPPLLGFKFSGEAVSDNADM